MYQPDVSPLFSKNANVGSKGASGFGAAPSISSTLSKSLHFILNP